MGKLLSLLARDDSNCCTAKSYDVFLDFENAAPTETEREIYEEVERVLKESDAVLEEIQLYKVSRKITILNSVKEIFLFSYILYINSMYFKDNFLGINLFLSATLFLVNLFLKIYLFLYIYDSSEYFNKSSYYIFIIFLFFLVLLLFF